MGSLPGESLWVGPEVVTTSPGPHVRRRSSVRPGLPKIWKPSHPSRPRTVGRSLLLPNEVLGRVLLLRNLSRDHVDSSETFGVPETPEDLGPRNLSGENISPLGVVWEDRRG